MACPHFDPVSRLDWAAWPGRLRPPLGAPYDGVCRAAEEPVHPEPETLRDCCNMGAAAGRCPRFRTGAGDSVRFSIAPSDDGGEARVRWLLEDEGLPLTHGELPASALDGETSAGAAPPLVVAQSRAYLAAYRAALPRVLF